MASYEEHTVLTTRVEFRVPVHTLGACWVEVYKAVRAAHQRLWDLGLAERDKDASDDAIRIWCDDEHVVVSFTVEEGPHGKRLV